MKRFTVSLVTVIGAVAISYCLLSSKQEDLKWATYHFQKPVVSVDVLKIAEAKVKENPQSYLDWGTLAGVYLSQARQTNDTAFIDKAEVAAKKSLKLFPIMNQGPKLILAEIAESRHEFDKAIALAKEVRKAGKSEALGTLITSYLGKGDAKRAFQFAQEYVQTRPGLGSYAARGLTLIAQGKDDLGEQDLLKAISLEDIGEIGPSLWIRFLLARNYFKWGRYELADKLCQEILKVDTAHHLALRCRAEIALAKNDLQTADDFYREAFAVSSEPPYALARARIQQWLGYPQKAEKLRKVAETAIRKEFAEGPYGHGSELMRLLLDKPTSENIREAILVGEKEYRKRQDPETLFLLAQVHAEAGNAKRATTLMEQIFATGIKDPKYFNFAKKVSVSRGVEKASLTN